MSNEDTLNHVTEMPKFGGETGYTRIYLIVYLQDSYQEEEDKDEYEEEERKDGEEKRVRGGIGEVEMKRQNSRGMCGIGDKAMGWI